LLPDSKCIQYRKVLGQRHDDYVGEKINLQLKKTYSCFVLRMRTGSMRQKNGQSHENAEKG
jgi:hypothetical protein